MAIRRTAAEPARSDLAIAPGELLSEELEARGWTQRELAARTGRPEQAISEIVRGKKAITPETALQLELALGVSAEFWLGLQTTYDLTRTRTAAAGATGGRRAVARTTRRP